MQIKNQHVYPLLDRYVKSGWSFFNTGTAQKKCLTKWTDYQHRKPTNQEIHNFINAPTQNYAIVCGEISNLIVWDVDTKNGGDPTPFLNRGLFEVRTPSGGYHFYTLYNPILANTKHKKSKKDGILHAVDVQSNGAIVFAPPSAFPNKEGILTPYTVVNDVPIGHLPDDLLTKVLEALEPEKEAHDVKPFKPIAVPEMGRPGDIFNALASWDDVLIPLGWQRVGQARPGGTQYWRRPGKQQNDGGVSASTNYKGYDLFFPYTKFFDELEQMKGYTKFNVLATLKYGGDYKKAAAALVMENYKLANNLE